VTPGAAFIHVGLQKTGTSYLQSHLWDSPQELLEQGVRMVPQDRSQSFRLAQAVLADDPGPARAVDDLRATVAAADVPVLLVSQESLAGASADRAAELKDAFADREVHVVVTARDLARQLPSAWQQRVKSHGQVSFPGFVRHVRERSAVVAGFWRQQDLVAVLDRWGQGLPPERVHVVTAPPAGSPPETLAERFGSVVGVDFTRLHADDLRTNVSLDPVQTEMLRRLNLRGRVFESRGAHARMVKQLLAGQVLAPHRTGSLRMPPEAADWCHEVADAQRTFVTERGYDVVGDLGDLVPRESAFGTGEPITDQQVLDVALDTVGELLRRLHTELVRGETPRLQEQPPTRAGRFRHLRRGRGSAPPR
jgi:hypothetical protein